MRIHVTGVLRSRLRIAFSSKFGRDTSGAYQLCEAPGRARGQWQADLKPRKLGVFRNQQGTVGDLVIRPQKVRGDTAPGAPAFGNVEKLIARWPLLEPER